MNKYIIYDTAGYKYEIYAEGFYWAAKMFFDQFPNKNIFSAYKDGNSENLWV